MCFILSSEGALELRAFARRRISPIALAAAIFVIFAIAVGAAQQPITGKAPFRRILLRSIPELSLLSH